MQIRGVNSFLWGASSNAARRHCPAAPSIQTKSGDCPLPPPLLLTPLQIDDGRSRKFLRRFHFGSKIGHFYLKELPKFPVFHKFFVLAFSV